MKTLKSKTTLQILQETIGNYEELEDVVPGPVLLLFSGNMVPSGWLECMCHLFNTTQDESDWPSSRPQACSSILTTEVMWTQQHYYNLTVNCKIADVNYVSEFNPVKQWKTVTPAVLREYSNEGPIWWLLALSISMINELPAGVQHT